MISSQPTEHSYLLVARPDEPATMCAIHENNSLFVGSSSNCRIQLPESDVDSIHCMFWMSQDRVLRVQDWNTDGKTLLNGSPIESEETVNSGDQLDICGYQIVAVLSEETHRAYEAILPVEREAECEVDAEIRETESQNADLNSKPVIPEPEIRTQRMPDSLELESGNIEPLKDVNNSPPEPANLPAADQFVYDIDANLDEPAESWPASTTIPVGFSYSDQPVGEADEAEVELLRLEVEHLRFELAQRDSQLEFTGTPEADSHPVDSEQTIQLVNRLEELLAELQSSDDRVKGLEELLRVSDEATQAERDERRQLEAWVTEIENRVLVREQESDAEKSQLVGQLSEQQRRTELAETQLNDVLNSNGKASSHQADPDAAAVTQALQQQALELQKRLEQTELENQSLRRQAAADEQATKSKSELHELEQKLLEMEVESSRERAEITRQRAELERLKGDLEHKLSHAKEVETADTRVQAIRQHLREIHEEEKLEQEERRQKSLSGRIANLLTRVGR